MDLLIVFKFRNKELRLTLYSFSQMLHFYTQWKHQKTTDRGRIPKRTARGPAYALK